VKRAIRDKGGINRRSLLMVSYAIYVTFVLILSSGSFLAEQEVRGILTDGEYRSHLVFPEDGDYGHYEHVTLANKSSNGVIDLRYIFDSNTLLIERAENIQELNINCRSMYNNKCQEVFEKDPTTLDPDFYKNYFMETNDGMFTVIINTETPMKTLQLIDIPIPTSVLVDNKQWWNTETSYYSIGDDDISISYIPNGSTTVIILFKDLIGENPSAYFTASKYVVPSNEYITFDATGSSDPDGQILHYIWDFGDGNEGAGENIRHSYSTKGEYTVRLTVRDDDYLEDVTTRVVHIVEDEVDIYFDSDHDGVPDVSDPNPYSSKDTDGDGLSDDFEEVITKTDSTNKDADGDGYDDNVELEKGTDPNNAMDFPSEEKEEKASDLTSILVFGVIIILIIIIVAVAVIKKGLKAKRSPIVIEPEEEVPDTEPKTVGPVLEEIPKRTPKKQPKKKAPKTKIEKGHKIDIDDDFKSDDDNSEWDLVDIDDK